VGNICPSLLMPALLLQAGAGQTLGYHREYGYDPCTCHLSPRSLTGGRPVLRKSYHKRIDSELKKEYKRYMAEVYSCNKNTLYYKADAIGQLERLKALFVNLHPKFKVVAS
jgi:hypothetical protein